MTQDYKQHGRARAYTHTHAAHPNNYKSCPAESKTGIIVEETIQKNI